MAASDPTMGPQEWAAIVASVYASVLSTWALVRVHRNERRRLKVESQYFHTVSKGVQSTYLRVKVTNVGVRPVTIRRIAVRCGKTKKEVPEDGWDDSRPTRELTDGATANARISAERLGALEGQLIPICIDSIGKNHKGKRVEGMVVKNERHSRMRRIRVPPGG